MHVRVNHEIFLACSWLKVFIGNPLRGITRLASRNRLPQVADPLTKNFPVFASSVQVRSAKSGETKATVRNWDRIRRESRRYFDYFALMDTALFVVAGEP